MTTLSFIGAGKVGSTLARLLHRVGYTIAAIHSRTPSHARQLAEHTASTATETLIACAKPADIVFLTVSDDAIQSVAQSLTPADWQGKAVIHTSGAASIDALDMLQQRGAMVGSLHPAFPFADVETAMNQLAGTTFAIEASHAALQAKLLQMVTALDGQPIIIPAGEKAHYHAALTIASNYTVTLYAIAQHMLTELGADEATANNALNVLVRATVENLVQQGIPDALTGALSRADVGTIQAHLRIINDDKLQSVYKNLARLSYPMLQQRGIDTDLIEASLESKP